MEHSKRQLRRIRRDRRREKRKIHVNVYVHRFLRVLVRWVLRPLFRVHPVNHNVILRARGPFVLLINHSAVIDPLIMGMFVNKPIHFVVSDSQFRSPVMSFLLGLTGAIPKTKAISDLDTVKKIVNAKLAGGIIGIFPEGQSSWDGHQLPLIRATDKLIKSLKIPVYAALIRGAYLSWPRWARRFRRGRIEVVFKRILDPPQLKAMSLDQINARVQEELSADAFDWQQEARTHYIGPGLAEYLERVLFICPECRRIGTLRSEGSRVICDHCGQTVRFTPQGFFKAHRGETRFQTVREWNVWQREEFLAFLDRQGASRDFCLLEEPAVLIREGYKTMPLKELGTGTMRLYRDRLEASLDNGGTVTFSLEQIEGMNVQNNEHLEFYADHSLFRISTIDPRGNTYKWNLAVHHLQG